MTRVSWLWIALLSLLLAPYLGAQQKWEYGGFAEASGQFYAKRPNPPDARAIGMLQLQVWASAKIGGRASWRGSLDFRSDTHHNIDRVRWFDLSQRGLRQPAASLHELYFDFHLGRIDFRAGHQQIRWGRADGFNPTDNLIPYDYLDTFADQRISAAAIKADTYLGASRIEAVWLPLFTPTRLPLLGHRWFPRLTGSESGSGVSKVPLEDGTRFFPPRTLGNGQWAVRWNQTIPRAEFSFSYFDGFNDLPHFSLRAIPTFDPATALGALKVALDRRYDRVRIAGADFASSLGPLGIRGEAAYIHTTDPGQGDYWLLVAGLDRAWGDWHAVVQYTDRYLRGSMPQSAVFPELAFRSALLYRVERNIGSSSSFEVKGAVRLRDGDLILQPLFSHSLSNNWRVKIGAMVFGGSRDTYFGQFLDNTGLTAALRFSF